MWYQVILALIFPNTICGLDTDGINFGIDYFKYKNVKLICLLTCQNDVYWSHQFTRTASNYSIAVSGVIIHSSEAGLSSVKKCLEYKLNSVGVLLDGNCDESEDVMFLASENLSYSDQHKWLIIENDKAVSGYDNNTQIDTLYMLYGTAIGRLDKLNVSVDADITVALRDNSGFYTLLDVYNVGAFTGGKFSIENVGSWDAENGLNISVDLNEYKYYRRWDFQNWTMRMILVAPPTIKTFDAKQFLDPEPVPGVAMLTYTAGSILYLVSEMHNFRYNCTVAERWIGTFKRSSIKVVADSIYFKEQDISPVIRFLPTVFNKIHLLIIPLASIETRYYYRIPTTGPGKFENQFLMPLSPVAWWGVIGISVLCAFLLMLSARFEHRPSSAQYAFFSVLATICQQFYEDNDDSGVKRESTARKTTIFITGLSCVLIYNYYTSSVVSWLLNGPPPSINSLKELLESPLELIFEDIGYTRSWMQTPSYYYNKRNAKIEDELRQKKVLNKKKDAPLFEPLVQGIKMVQDGGYAYHTEVYSANKLIAKTFDQNELCELGSLQSMEKTNLYGNMPKESPYKEFFTWSLIRLLERGFVNCIQTRTSAPEVTCEGSSPRALALGGAAPAFILLAGGYTLAFIIMLLERTLYKIRHGHLELN